jgi:hypothetical protein
MDGSDFARRKHIGTSAEMALRDILTSTGALVACNQQNRDAVLTYPGAAVAHLGTDRVHMPDLSVTWAAHSIRRFGVEVKAKSPMGRGGWGWDIHAFDRACRWAEASGDPVFYAVRDLSAAPLPPAGCMDDVEHWHVASTWKLLHSSSLYTDDQYHYWPADTFMPLAVLLHGGADISAAIVPYIALGTGAAPLVL